MTYDPDNAEDTEVAPAWSAPAADERAGKTVVYRVPPVQTRASRKRARQERREERTRARAAGRSGASTGASAAQEPDGAGIQEPEPLSARGDRRDRQASPGGRQAARRTRRRGASGARWLFRLLMLGCLVFGLLTVSYLTEQTVDETSALSAAVEELTLRGASTAASGLAPALEDDPVAWAAYQIVFISAKLMNHGLTIRRQAHIVEFALLGAIISLNVLAWASGTRHRHGFLMATAALALCACASFLDQYHKLYVPGREFDVLDLALDAVGYVGAVVVVFSLWRIGSGLWRAFVRD